MKDQYCGDINDYRKYGLLRQLTHDRGLSLGVNWMLTPGDGSTDGKHTVYLAEPARWRAHDTDLFDGMHAIVNQKGRAVRHVEESGLFPGARFFSEIVPDEASGRREWFNRSKRATAAADLVFFDPDNGVEVPSVRCGHKGSSKYLYWSEVEQAWAGGHSLLIYQHYPRIERGAFVASLTAGLRSRTGEARVFPLSTANVVFFLVIQQSHLPALQSALPSIARRWAGQVEVLGSVSCESQVPSSSS